MIKTIFTLLLAATAAASAVAGSIEGLGKDIAKGLKDRKGITIAVLGFQYHDGTESSGSSLVQEGLTTYLAGDKRITVVERNLLKKIFEEKKFEMSGLVDKKDFSEIGKLTGADAIVTGTLHDISDSKTEVDARVVDAGTGKILTAASATIKRTWSDSPVKPGNQQNNPPKNSSFLGKPLIQMAILLDTSNSMDGLINQARTQIWKIVNELGSAEKGGSGPEVQIAVYEYGNNSLSRTAGYIRQVMPFTTDLDVVSEKLFGLTTNGGDEYCGYVIKHAAEDLGWDKHADVYKTIFIAGNEPFTQGPEDFRTAVAEAAAKGIAVNTVYCGRKQQGMAEQWEAAAKLGNGEYTNIDQSAATAYVKAPQDDEIQTLSTELNTTYIPYGSDGTQRLETKSKQDALASAAPGAGVERARFKTSEQNKNSDASWDIISALETGKLKEKDIKPDQLPDSLKKMSEKERSAYFSQKLGERKQLRDRLNELQKQRRIYTETAASHPETATFDTAVIKAVRKQAAERGFRFKN